MNPTVLRRTWFVMTTLPVTYTGKLAATGQVVETGSPSCILFARPGGAYSPEEAETAAKAAEFPRFLLGKNG